MANSAITRASMAGVGPGVGAGMWTLVERKILSSPATNITFTGLNGDVDLKYYISMRVVSGGNNNVLYMKPNGDTTTNIYTYAQSETGGGGGTGQTNAGFMVCFTSDLVGASQHAEGILWAQTGANRTYVGSQQRLMTASSAQATTHVGAWKETITPITSLVFTAAATNDFGTGTIIELWKLGPPPPIAQGEWSLVERYTVVGSAVTSKTFSGLNGNVDGRYKVVFDVKAGGSGYGSVWFNSDTTAANYTTARHYYYAVPAASASQGTAQDLATGGITGVHFTSGYRSTGEVSLHAISGYPRMIRTTNTEDENSEIDCFDCMGRWKTATNTENITAINFGGVTNCLGVGSVIELWKLAQ